MNKATHISRQITNIFIYLMLFAYPLFLGFHGYTKVTISKFLFFFITTALWLICLLTVHIFCKTLPAIKPKNPVVLLIFLFLLFNIASAVFSEYGTATLWGLGRYDGLITAILYIAIFLGVSQFAKPRTAYIYVFAASISICCIIAIIQFFGINVFGFFPSNYDYYDMGIKYSGEFMGTVGNADLVSALLCIAVPLFSVFYLADTKASTGRFALLIAIFLASFCLLHCTVSAGKLALLATIILSAPFLITNTNRLRKAFVLASVLSVALSLSEAFGGEKIDGEIVLHFTFGVKHALLLAFALAALTASLFVQRLSLEDKKLRCSLLIISSIAIIGSLIFTFNYKGTSGSLYEASQIMHGNFNDSFGSSRIRIWRESLALFPESPVLGGGPGTLSNRIDIHFSRYVEETGKTLSCGVDNAHNIYIGMLINTGLLSLLCFISAMIVTLIKSIKSKQSSIYTACIASALLCYWIQEFFGLGLFITMPFMWLLWGLLVQNLYNHKPKITEEA